MFYDLISYTNHENEIPQNSILWTFTQQKLFYYTDKVINKLIANTNSHLLFI